MVSKRARNYQKSISCEFAAVIRQVVESAPQHTEGEEWMVEDELDLKVSIPCAKEVHSLGTIKS